MKSFVIVLGVALATVIGAQAGFSGLKEQTTRKSAAAETPAPTASPGLVAFKVGAAGHHQTKMQPPYGKYSMATAIKDLQHLGVTIYRANAVGKSSTTRQITAMGSEVGQLLKAGIDPVIVLNPYPLNDPETDIPYATETAAYEAGYDLAVSVRSALKDKAIKYWEIGNEVDLMCLKRPADQTDNGLTPDDYDTYKYERCRGGIKGTIAGLRSWNPAAKVIVGSSGWKHWGYQQRLYDDGVQWDYSGFHWYSKMNSAALQDRTIVPGEDFGGEKHYNIFAFLKSLGGKPIVCTEFNAAYYTNTGEIAFPDRKGGSDDQARAEWLIYCLDKWKSIAAKCDFRFACIYELLDQPMNAGLEQQTKGVLVFNRSTGLTTKKPQAIEIKAWNAAQ